MLRRLCVIGFFACACSSSVEMRGARALPRDQPPPATHVAGYQPRECADANGARLQRNTVVYVMGTPAGARLLEARPGYDSLLVENVFEEKDELVFQFILDSTLVDFRVKKSGAGAGRMAITRRFSKKERRGGGFRASVATPDLTCKLVPQAELTDVPEPPVAPSEPPPPPSFGEPHKLDAYRVGDEVAVGRAGQWRPAKVRQALGGRYFVEYADGNSAWVDAGQVVGKLR